jgi:hypothetical protein
VLLVLHKIYDKGIKKSSNDTLSDTFSFEITKIGNRIRFFITCDKKYKDFLTNQIYAHYSNVEIHEVKDYFSAVPKDKIQLAELELQKHYIYPINIF